MKPKIRIKKGYCLIVTNDTTENLCKNCFFHNPRKYGYGEYDKIKKGRRFYYTQFSACLKSVYLPCPSKAHLGGQNMIYKTVKIKEVQNA
jgi:hypothetical protein